MIVGNAKKIIPGLMKLGFPIKKYDRYAEPVADEVKETKVAETGNSTDAISGNSIMQDYFKAIGGKEEAAKVTSFKADISLDLGGRTFTGTDVRMLPYKTVTEIKMGTMTVMKALYDGKGGFQQQGPQKKDMDEGELKEAQDEKSVFPQLTYSSKEYVGKGKVGDEETYRLKVTFPSGRTSVQQYSTKTGLLLQEETTSKQEGQDVPMTVDYKDYKKVGAFMIPHSVTRNIGGQEFTMVYSNIKLNEGVTDADFK